MKNAKRINFCMPANQEGAALIVSLVILAVITVLGVANMQSSAIEMKMAVSTKDRSVAMAAAESALAQVEKDLNTNRPDATKLIDTCGTGNTCFESTCSGGRCFQGTYTATDTPYDCKPFKSGTTPEDVWTKSTNWNKAQAMDITGVDQKVKYLVEFLCYVDSTKGQPFGNNLALNENPYNGSPLYRITVLAEGNGKRASVMLQSTYALHK